MAIVENNNSFPLDFFIANLTNNEYTIKLESLPKTIDANTLSPRIFAIKIPTT